MAQRLTRKTAEILCARLNETLGLPKECYLQQEDGRYNAQIGCIHIYGVNGGYNVCQMINPAGGVRVLAYGLSAREAYQWLTAALEGIRLARTPFPH